MPFDALERLAVKRQRLVDQRLQRQSAENGQLSHNAASHFLNSSLPSKTDIPQENTLTGTQNDQNGFSVIHKLFNMPETCFSEGRNQQTKVELQSDPDCTHQSLITILHKSKKSKKHKGKERDWLTDDKWLETSKLKQKPIKSGSK